MPDSYGIIVEGDYDVPVFKKLVERISANNPRIEALTGDGSKLPRLFPVLLRRLEHILDGHAVQKAIVIKDADGRNVQEVERELAQRIAKQAFAFRHPVQFFALQQEMETWLLADEGSINRVADSRGARDGVPRIQEQLEEIRQAKERLQSVLSRAGLAYDPAVCGEVANEISLDILRHRCPSFIRFQQKVLDG